mmetsp:Transcript_67866/g.145293  ORF Transcript_67866/g.145293 Transcript_67866/m.145293 type:complete len:195 (+) Transcript_67866:54-638(+)
MDATNRTGQTFLEIGALDGITFSDTYFYENKLGWGGLLIEAELNNFKALERNRNGTGTLKLHAGICKTKALLTMRGTGPTASASHIPRAGQTSCPCLPMHELVGMAGLKRIDLFSIDVEGAELDVVETHDWVGVPVRIVLVVMHPPNEKSAKNARVRMALHQRGLCRFASSVGHNNEVWINPSFEDQLNAKPAL